MTKQFKKGLIIIGKECAGKSMLAEFILKGHKAHQVVRLNGRDKGIIKNKFAFRALTSKTKVVLVDDLHRDIPIQAFFCLIVGELEVHRQAKESIIVNTDPIQVIVTSAVLNMEDLLSPSLQRRFDIIEVRNCGYQAKRESEVGNAD